MTTKSRSELLGGRYRLQRQIGSGGMAGVYLARDERLGRDVAVKLTEPVRDVSGEATARIEQEARRAARLNHPNIVQVHDVGTTDDDAYIVMELVEGRGLDEVIQEDGPLSEAETTRIATQVCHGLAAAHAAGLVHQDIKPSNLLVDSAGRVRIADFGVARAHDGDTLTAEQPFGSAPYVSPEQVEGRRTDHRSDLYSLGVVLYEMLTGRRPFRGDTMASTVLQRLHQDPDPPSRWADVSPEVDAVVMRALARDPDDRFDDAEAMSAALLSAVEEGGAGDDDRTVLLPVRPPRNRAVRNGALLLLALATLAVAGWAVSSSLAPAPTTASAVAVPDVSGMTVGVASRVLAESNLEVGDITMDQAPAAPLGTVLAQFPAPGSEVDPGGTVHLIVAGGSPAPTSGPGSPEPDGGATGGDAGGDRSDAPAADGAPDSQEDEETSDEPASTDGPAATDPPGRGGTPPGQGGDPPGKGRP